MSRHPKAPPYSVAHAHKIIADFEHAVRQHEGRHSIPFEEWFGIHQHWQAERAKMFTRLTEPTISTRIKK